MSGTAVAAAVTFALLVPVPAQADGTVVSGGAPGQTAAAPAPVAAKVVHQDIPATPVAQRKAAPKLSDDDKDLEHPEDSTVVAELSSTGLKKFSMLGVTWDGGLDDASTVVQVRWRTDGAWSTWTELHAEPAPEEGGRSGTEPYWVGSADAAEVKVVAGADSRPTGLELSTIDPAVDESADTVDPVVDVTPAASVGKPAIISRSSWGASNSGKCDSPIYGSGTRGAVIHHTAGTNSYSKSQSKAIVKATQAYHTKSRKWCDIGYNFLVDKYGQTFEGRAGGTTKAVRAAHSGNAAVNEQTVGISMMGTFSKTAPSAALKTAVANLVAWRFSLAGLKAKGTYKLGGKTLNRIAGHRNVVGTECPGEAAYKWLGASGGLRDQVERRLATGSITAQVGSRSTSAVTATGFTIKWAAFAKAAKYEVFTSTSRTTPTTCSGTRCTVRPASPTSVTLTGLSAGSTQYVWVRAISSTGKPLTVWQTSPKTVNLVKAQPEPTAVVTARQASSITSTGYRLSWRAVSGAATYQVHSSTSATRPSACGTGCTSHSATASPAVALSGFAAGTTQHAWVRALDASGRLLTTWQETPKVVRLEAGASTVTVPSSGKITVKGRGFGHGIGMSQYGAQGAAKKGVKHDKILATYYPGTKLASKSGQIRVLISQDTTDSVEIAGRSGLYFRKGSSARTMLPTTVSGKKVIRWRILQVSSKRTQSTLQYRTSSTWKSYQGTHWTGDGQFEGPASITLIMPNGSGVAYRGVIRSAVPSKGSTARDTVNVLPIEHYVQGVVSAEMPSSWAAEALKAQSIAARTYGVRSLMPSRYYDICSTTACQVYGGLPRETSATNSAVAGTRGKILTYAGKPAFTQFSSSSGGFTAMGSQPYLKAVADPYDDWSGNPNRSWSTTVTAKSIQNAYPSIGTLKQLRVTKRTGGGAMGGRVVSLNLVGSKKTVTISGTDARWALGLKSHWFGF